MSNNTHKMIEEFNFLSSTYTNVLLSTICSSDSMNVTTTNGAIDDILDLRVWELKASTKLLTVMVHLSTNRK